MNESKNINNASLDLYKLNFGVCMLCKHQGMDFVNRLRDDKTRCAAKCGHCGHVQITPLPTPEEDEYYYQQDRMMKDTFKEVETLQTEEQLMYRMELFVREQADTFEKYLPSDYDLKILEIGSGFGWLPQFMQEKGWKIDGVEINDEKRILCKKRCGIELQSWNFLYDVPEALEKQGFYDVLCIMQTLEHITDPKTFLNRAGMLLKPGGIIYIDIPNFNDWYREHQKEYNDWSFMRSHVSYFTPEILTKTLEETGFKDINVYGHQPHSIENALHWWRNKGPNFLWHQFYLPEPLEWINEIYKEKIEKELKSSFMVAIGYKV